MPYKFDKTPQGPSFELPPVGDYEYIVVECNGEPVLKDSLNYVLALKLALVWNDQKVPIFANPWARSEKSATQDGRDDIALFLLSLGLKPGHRVEWQSLVGKKGKCRIKHEKERAVAGQENKGRIFARVDYFIVGRKNAEKATEASASDFEKARQAQLAKTKGDEPEPEDSDSIPY